MSIRDIIRNHYKDKGFELWRSHDKLFEKALNDFESQKFKKLLAMKYELEDLGDYMKDIKNLEDDYKHQIKIKTAKANNNQYAFITINPKPDTDLAHFVKKLNDYVNRQICEKHLYVLEQRGENAEECGKGLHAHILVKRNLNYKPCKFILNTKNTFKNIVGNEKHIHIQICGEDFKNDKILYITGKNKDDSKSIKQEYDTVYRANNKLSEFYGELF